LSGVGFGVAGAVVAGAWGAWVCRGLLLFFFVGAGAGGGGGV
jgi:hypothetical protein